MVGRFLNFEKLLKNNQNGDCLILSYHAFPAIFRYYLLSYHAFSMFLLFYIKKKRYSFLFL